MDHQDVQGERKGAMKWGAAAVGGWQAVPDVLLRYQDKLGLKPNDLVVLLNICMHWWKTGENPWPRPNSIAKRMGVTTRTVERGIANLQRLGLLKKAAPGMRNDGTKVIPYDVTPLVERLEALSKWDIQNKELQGAMPTETQQAAPS